MKGFQLQPVAADAAHQQSRRAPSAHDDEQAQARASETAAVEELDRATGHQQRVQRQKARSRNAMAAALPAVAHDE